MKRKDWLRFALTKEIQKAKAEDSNECERITRTVTLDSFKYIIEKRIIEKLGVTGS